MIALPAGAFAIALAILCGAFGAHALRGLDPEHARYWATAADYHFIGGFGLVTLGLLQRTRPGVGAGALWAFAAGIGLFSGSLYAMALGAPRALGMITPVGGLSLVAGWLWIGWLAVSRKA